MVSRCSLGRTIFLRSRIDGEAILGTLKYCENFNPGDSTTFNAEVDVIDENMITFINTKPTLGGSAATAEVRNFIGHHNSNH
jgi:hypothetical protein